jgi:ATP-dependent Clp protease ATP-binding subunit ClpA
MSMPQRYFLTTRAHRVFAMAHDLADQLGHDDVTPLHFALCVVREGRSVAVGALLRLGVPLAVLERELEAGLPPGGAPRLPASERTWSATDERMIEQALAEAGELGTEHYGCEHLLLAVLRDRAGAPAQVLARHGVGLDEARAEVVRIYNVRPS